MSEFISSIDEGDGVRRVRIRRPEKRNALCLTTMRALCDVLEAAESDTAVRVLLFDSLGPVFCAGADVDGLAGEPPALGGDWGHRFLVSLTLCGKPLVAAVQGPAVGIGFTMLLHFDLVYAAPEARFLAPFVDLGVTPEGGSSVLLPERMGLARAGRLLLLGEWIDAAEALASGLITQIVNGGAKPGHWGGVKPGQWQDGDGVRAAMRGALA